MNSTRSTDFITPKSASSRLYRDAVLELAGTEAFARPLVNSGRLSTPTPYLNSPLNTPDESSFGGSAPPGRNAPDAPIAVGGRRGWLLDVVGGNTFTVLTFGNLTGAREIKAGRVGAKVIAVGRDIADTKGLLNSRYDGVPGTVYLLRPDQHVAARWRGFDEARIKAAIARACGN